VGLCFFVDVLMKTHLDGWAASGRFGRAPAPPSVAESKTSKISERSSDIFPL
jgi:hypothetical protein